MARTGRTGSAQTSPSSGWTGTRGTEQVYRFEYRVPRYRTDIPVRLTLSDTTFVGQCKEISKEGVTAEFPSCPIQDSCGTIQFAVNGVAIRARVRVTHTQAHSCGLRFLFESEAERLPIDRVVALLTAPLNRLGPHRVK